MPSRWDTANRGWRRRVFHYPPPTLLSGNFRLPCAIELQPFPLTPLKMRKVQIGTWPGLFVLPCPSTLVSTPATMASVDSGLGVGFFMVLGALSFWGWGGSEATVLMFVAVPRVATVAYWRVRSCP